MRQVFALTQAHKGIHFRQEHSVARKVGRRRDGAFGLIPGVGHLRDPAGIIPADRTALKREIERVRRRTLIIIQVDSGTAAVLEAEDQFGVILNIQFQRAQICQVCRDRADLTHEPTQVIDRIQRVRDFTDHSSCIRVAVSPGMPTGGIHPNGAFQCFSSWFESIMLITCRPDDSVEADRPSSGLFERVLQITNADQTVEVGFRSGAAPASAAAWATVRYKAVVERDAIRFSANASSV